MNRNIFNATKVLVIGDVMIDQYLSGQSHRNSPEADVPVLEEVSIRKELGGAANVAINLRNLLAEPYLLSVVGKDPAGAEIKTLLNKENIKHEILKDSDRKTTVKTRVYLKKEQMLRVDIEDKHSLSASISEEFLEKMEHIVSNNNIKVAILQDYNKGVLNKGNIASIISLLKRREIFIALDPKKDNFYLYQGIDLYKPNLAEMMMALDVKPSEMDLITVQNMATELYSKLSCRTLIVTLGAMGITFVDKKGSYYKEALPLDLVDVCGAGDAVISVISLALYHKMSPEEILQYAVKTGKIVCEKTGVAGIAVDDLFE